MVDDKNGECRAWASCGGWLISAVLAGVISLTAILVLLERIDILKRAADAQLANLICLSVLALIVALAARDGTLTGFVAAGRRTRPVANALSASAVWLPAGSLVPLFAMTYVLGVDGLGFVLGPAAGLVIGGVLVVPYLARSGALSSAEFIGMRFGRAARVIAALIIALITLLLACAGLAGFAAIVESTFGITFTNAALIGIAAVLICTLPGGMMSVTWTGAAFAIVMLTGVLVTAGWLLLDVTGWGIPQIAYGELLNRIDGLERSMLEKGVASAETMTPHLRPYLQLDEPNYFALLFCLAAGTAVLPQLLSRSFAVASARDARSSAAWTALLAVILLITVPAYAALSKYNLYKTVDQSIALADLPDWSKDLSRTSRMQIYGVSLGLFEAVAAGVQSGAADPSAVATHLYGVDADLSQAWSHLKAPVQTEILQAAKAAGADGKSDLWDPFRTKLLPEVARQSGNEAGRLTLTDLDVDGGALALALPRIEGLPYALSGMLLVAALAAALAMMTASIMTAATALGYDALLRHSEGILSDERATFTLRLAILACSVAVGGVVVSMKTKSFVDIAPTAVSFAAAALLPALSLGIWWKRANAWGAIAGMLGGLALVLYYMCATNYAPVAFFETWAPLSNADPDYAMEFWALHEAWLSASGEAKEAARVTLEAFASGTVFRPSLANWFGVMPMAAGALAVPVAFVLTILVSLITPRPQASAMALIARLRQPSPPPPKSTTS